MGFSNQDESSSVMDNGNTRRLRQTSLSGSEFGSMAFRRAKG